MLQEKLRTTEKQMEECEDTKYRLSVDIQTLQLNTQRLNQRIKEGNEMYELCAGFLKKNGIECGETDENKRQGDK